MFARVFFFLVCENFRAAMLFHDNGTTLSYAVIIGAFGAIVFILGITVTRWEEGE